jgi:hypothetical protein
MEALSRVTTKDVLAVLVVAATLLFNGISLITGKPLDAATMTLAGAVVGHYFQEKSGFGGPKNEEPLPEPYIGGGDADE